MPDARPVAQLQMLWPERLFASPPRAAVPDGYALRQFARADADAYLTLMAKAGFRSWDHAQIEKVLPSVLPGGWFVIEQVATRRLVATAMARHRPLPEHPGGGELSWVAADPEHKGRRLGTAACAAVIERFIEAGYRRIYLLTDDWRLPAIRIYLALGFEPYIPSPEPAERWAAVLRQLHHHGLATEGAV